MHLILLHVQEPALKAAQIPIPEGVSPRKRLVMLVMLYNENTIYIYGRFANIHTKNHLDVPGKYFHICYWIIYGSVWGQSQTNIRILEAKSFTLKPNDATTQSSIGILP